MSKKSIKDEVLIALTELNRKVVPLDVSQHIMNKGISLPDTRKGMRAQVSDNLWHLWKVGSISKDGDYYFLNDFKEANEGEESSESTEDNNSSFYERELHPLLVAFLESRGISSKTIYHERSSQSDKGQTWVHPDVVGIKFATFKKNSTKDILRSTNVEESYNIYSYKLKIRIDTDNNLKKYFF